MNNELWRWDERERSHTVTPAEREAERQALCRWPQLHVNYVPDTQGVPSPTRALALVVVALVLFVVWNWEKLLP